MTITKSLSECLLNAIVRGDIPGVQVKRKFGTAAGDERRCFDALNAVIERHAASVRAAHEDAYRAAVRRLQGRTDEADVANVSSDNRWWETIE